MIIGGTVEPLPTDPPELRHAYRLAMRPATAWRMHYAIPPTDPRFVEMTDEAIIFDLLMIHMHAGATQRRLDPSAADAEDFALDDEKHEAMQERARVWLDQESTQKGIRSLLRGGYTDEEWKERKSLRKLVLSGKTSTSKIVKP